MSHKVRVGTSYIFYANLLDYKHRDLNGRVGTVVGFYGTPKAYTMGHAYFQVEGERFRLVSTNSLYKMSGRQLVIDAIRQDIFRAQRALPIGYHGRFDMLSVDDIKWLAAMQIDPIEEAPPDTRTWRPRTEVPLTDF